jgi:hypothetical protein
MAPPHPVLEPIGRGYQNKLLGNAGGAAPRPVQCFVVPVPPQKADCIGGRAWMRRPPVVTVGVYSALTQFGGQRRMA